MNALEELNSGKLKGATHLKLRCELKEFPIEIFSLAETLEVLDLSGNSLSQLPEDFNCLKKLRIAFFSDNLFTEFPPALAKCKNLDTISFKSN